MNDLRNQRSAPIAALLAAVLVLAGCGDDAVCPCDSGGLWTDIQLPDVGKAVLLDVAASGSRVVATGFAAGQGIAVQSTATGWETLELPPSPVGALFSGVTLDASAHVVLVGGSLAGMPLLVDERVGWQTMILAASGFLNAVIVGTGDSLVAVGTASGGLAATSTASGSWVLDHAGFTTPSEKGLVDVDFKAGVFVACGWDDETLQSVVRVLDDSGWKDFSRTGLVMPPEDHVENRAVCFDKGGSLWLGGAVVTTTAHGDSARAMLARRSPGADWVDVEVPDAARTQSVNDILCASDGNLYLACGESETLIWRWDGLRWHEEGAHVAGRMLALAEDPTGHVYVAGYRDEEVAPLLRVRNP